MKKYYFLIIVALILGLVLTGCSLLSNVGQVPTTEQSGMSYLTKGTETEPESFPLYAGQDMLVGEVLVWDDGTQLCIKYQLNEAALEEGWLLTETHLAVATSLNGIPQTKKNNPIPGKFPYGNDELGGVEEDGPYCIPFGEEEGELDVECGDDLFIAAHAVVKKYENVCIDFEEYEEYDEVSAVLTAAGNINFYMTDYSGMISFDGSLSKDVGDVVTLLPTSDLYPVVAEENTKDPDHNYMDLDMENIVGFTVGTTFEDDWVKDDPDNTGAGGKLLTDVPDYTLDPFWQHAYSNFQAILMDFTQLNMLKSVSFAGVDLDWDEVWYVLYFDSDNTIIHIETIGPPSGQTLDGIAFPITYSDPDIDKIVIWGSMNAGIDGKVGFAIDNVCAEAVVQEETAWAGEDPFDGKNWATYFIYIPECECVEQFWQIGTPDGPVNPIIGAAEYPATRAYSEEYLYIVGDDLDPIGAPSIPGYIGSTNVCSIDPNRPCTDTTMSLNIQFDLYCSHVEGELVLIYDRYGSETDTLYFDFDGTPFATVVATEGGFKQFNLPLPAAAAGTHTITIAYEGLGHANGHYIDYLKLVNY